jgi:acetyl esterase/lipase
MTMKLTQHEADQISKKRSLRGRIAYRLVRSIVRGWPEDNSAALVQRARRIFGRPMSLGPWLTRGIKVEPVAGEVQGEWLTPVRLDFPDSVLLYLHGGGYVSCSARSHRPITTTLARQTGCRVFSLNYRLAPEYPFPAAVDDAVNAFQWLLKSGIQAQNIALAGDSAGGGLTVATMLRLRDEKIPLPACAACIAPWVDLLEEFTPTNTDSCAMFLPVDGRNFAKVYLNGASAHSPLASPLFGDLHGLPPLLIQVADTEMLFDDSFRLNEKAQAAGVQSRLHIYKGLPHVWHMFVGLVPEAGEALTEISNFIRGKMAASSAALRGAGAPAAVRP